MGEIPDEGNSLFGMAVSDKSEYNSNCPLPINLPAVVDGALENNLGLELQIEGDLKSQKIPKIQKPLFLGLHLPISGLVLRNPYNRFGTDKVKWAMEYAAGLGADYVVAHLGVETFWDKLKRRQRRIDMDSQALDRLVETFRYGGYEYKLFIENVEFPQFPATQIEILCLANTIKQLGYPKIAVALDAAHLYHSGLLIAENKNNPDIGRLDAWARGESPFRPYYEKTLESLNQDFNLVHISGCKGHLTHLEINATEPDLSLEKLTGLYKQETKRNRTLIYVNEAHLDSYARLIVNTKVIRAYLG